MNTLISPRYLSLHIKESAKAMFGQLTKFKICKGNGVFLSGTLLYERISKYFPHEIPQYETSRQNQKRIGYLLNTTYF